MMHYVHFADYQQQAGVAAWVPFHESASAVTQLYRGTCIKSCVIELHTVIEYILQVTTGSL